MDVQQLTSPASGTLDWSLRTASDAAEAGPLAVPTPWWVDGEREPEAVGTDEAAEVTAPRVTLGALLASVAVVALLLSATAGVALVSGLRWFVVQTPSMGPAAPVGSLVLTHPASAALRVGEVIAFTPPGAPRVYTHRVLSVAADGSVRTKGDINGAPDGWTIQRAQVLGEAFAIVPGLGFLLRGLPVLIVGALLLWVATAPIRRADRRAAARIIGLHLVATLVVLWVQPFVRVVLLATTSAAEGVRSTIVSTGLLPIKLVDSTGTVLAHLASGVPRVVAMRSGSARIDRIIAEPDAGWALQAVLIGIALLPALVVLVVGLPRPTEERA